MDLVVVKRDVVLVDRVPLLDAQLLRARARLRCEQLLEIANRILRVALDPNLLAKPVVADHLNHVGQKSLCKALTSAGRHTYTWSDFLLQRSPEGSNFDFDNIL